MTSAPLQFKCDYFISTLDTEHAPGNVFKVGILNSFQAFCNFETRNLVNWG